MPRYEVYKDFGVEGRDNPTDRWDSKALKYLVDYNIKTLAEDTDPEYELKYIEIGDVNNIGEILNTTTYSFKNAPSRCRRVLSKDDVFISTVRTYLKAIGYIKEECEDFVCSTGFCVLSPKESLNPGYLYYSIIDEKFLNEVISKSTGVSYPAITPTQLVNIKINIPPLTEQTQIVEFLDSKTSLIDKLISVKQRKIELLKEKRTALINHVVTKGLNPNVKMKESGVEWIGEIPEHWLFLPIKYLLKKVKNAIKTGPFGSQLKSDDIIGSGFKVYNQRTVYDNDYHQGENYISDAKFELLKEFKVIEGDILITSRGTIGKCSIVPPKIEIGVLHPCLIRIQIDEGILAKLYLHRYINQSSLFIDGVKYESNSTTIEVIYSDTIKNYRLPLPPFHEQTQIIEFLDEKTKEIDNLLILEQKKIDLLKEYRQSLISEVVTGKIKVTKD